MSNCRCSSRRARLPAPIVLPVPRLAALLLVLLVAACGSEGTAAKQPLPTHKVGKSARLAGLDAVLDGSAADECLWVGAPGHRVDVSWPNGYSMSVKPLALRNRRGRIVARVGE